MKELNEKVIELFEMTNSENRNIMHGDTSMMTDMLRFEKSDLVRKLTTLKKNQLIDVILNYQSTLEAVWEEIENANERMGEE